MHRRRVQLGRTGAEVVGEFLLSLQLGNGAGHCFPLPPERGSPLWNLLCLCPNCHVLFDAGAYVLTDDLRVVDTVTDRPQSELKRHRWHYINPDHVRHQRHHWTSRNPAPLSRGRQ
ncbi:HNH endonuclease [Streptomyces sp. NPDC056004]|uniref:HNH endonuclease n=1 Tax=Streptomyces sp. NPDC056004 TaxID=3345677 RepID=UPI0035E00EF6